MTGPDAPPTVVFASTHIRPGGGPAGYMHHLREGFTETATTGREMSVVFVGESRLERLPTNRPLARPITTLAKQFVRRYVKSSEEFANAGVLVIQGFQWKSGEVKRAHRRGAAVVYQPHSPRPYGDECYGHMRGSRFARWLVKLQASQEEKRLFRGADYVVFPTVHAAECYAKFEYLWRHKVKYIATGIATSFLEHESPLAAMYPRETVLFMGRYVSDKGYDLFVEAAKILAQRSATAIEFVSYGAGPISAQFPVDDRGWTATPYEPLSHRPIVVLPNRHHYFDLLALEAAAYGCPLILSLVGGGKDLVSELPDSVPTEAEARAIAAAIQNAMSAREADPAFGHRNARVFSEKYTAIAMAEAWRNFCLTILEGTR